jgi:hypothetical protein
MNKSRRNFAKNFFKRSIARLTEAKSAYERGISESEYFQSFENAYPLISEYYNYLEDEARRLGIDTRNKSKLDLAREVYMQNGPG